MNWIELPNKYLGISSGQNPLKMDFKPIPENSRESKLRQQDWMDQLDCLMGPNTTKKEHREHHQPRDKTSHLPNQWVEHGPREQASKHLSVFLGLFFSISKLRISPISSVMLRCRESQKHVHYLPYSTALGTTKSVQKSSPCASFSMQVVRMKDDWIWQQKTSGTTHFASQQNILGILNSFARITSTFLFARPLALEAIQGQSVSRCCVVSLMADSCHPTCNRVPHIWFHSFWEMLQAHGSCWSWILWNGRISSKATTQLKCS